MPVRRDTPTIAANCAPKPEVVLLTVTGEVRYCRRRATRPLVRSDQKWCPREGIVAESPGFADVRTPHPASTACPSIRTPPQHTILWSARKRWTTSP